MKSRTTLSLIVLIILSLSLAACTRSASTAPTESVPFPEAATQEGMNMIQELATQTALAESGAPAAESTPEAAAVDPMATLPPLTDETPVVEAQPVEVTPTPEVIVVAQPVAEPVRPATYTLQKGEFPYCIARRFNVNPADLLALNGLTTAQSNSLQPGLVLKIPATGVFNASRALLPHPTQHTVQAGESIYSIACKYGDVDPVNIAAVNGLGAPFTLTVGSVLQIP